MVYSSIDSIKNTAASLRRSGKSDEEIRAYLKKMDYDDDKITRILNSIPKYRKK